MKRGVLGDAGRRGGARRPARRSLASLLVVVLGALLAGTPSCKTPEVTFELNVPSSISQQVAWFEIGVYPSPACPPPSQLTGGIAPEGAVARVAFPSDDPSPPAIGTLAKNRYSFAATARQADCTVIAVGCTSVDVNDSRDISISLSPTAANTGACPQGEVCNDARCVPGSNNGDPSVGAGCSLALMGSGPLADPLSDSSTLLSAPVVVATDTGFLIAYREFDTAASMGRLTLIPVDNGGGSAAPMTTTLPQMCGPTNGGDATAMAFDPGGNLHNGLVALARPACGGDSGMATPIGLDFFQVDSGGNVGQSGFRRLPGNKVSLAEGHALTAAPGGYLLAMTIDGQTYQAPVAGVDLAQNPVVFGASTTQTAAFVAASPGAVALMALGTVAGGPPPSDGGSEGGDAGPPPPPPEGGAPGEGLQVNVAAPGTDLSNLPPPFVVPAQWGSLSVVGTRVLVASNGTTPGKPVVWSAFDLGNPMLTATDGFDTAAQGKVAYADVALHQDHGFFAVEAVGMTGTISLVAFSHISTTPVFVHEMPFATQPSIPIGDVRDGLVSVAASDTRVAVVWGTSKMLSTNDAVGGYAVFACTP